MGIFKKIFGTKSELDQSKPEQPGTPDNTKLIFLLNNYIKYRGDESYRLVMEELLNGNSFLMLPTINDETVANDWTSTKVDTQLKLTTMFNLDGLKVLGAFTDTNSMYTWAKKEMAYTGVKSQGVLEMCKDMGVNRIVINSDSANMFIVQRNANMKELTIPNGLNVMIGTPARPLDEHIIQDIKDNFSKIENILEAYQYMLTQNNEANITIGVRLAKYNDNARKAAIYAVQNALNNLPKEQYVDILFLDTNKWYDMVKDIEGAKFYSK